MGLTFMFLVLVLYYYEQIFMLLNVMMDFRLTTNGLRSKASCLDFLAKIAANDLRPFSFFIMFTL